MKNKSYILLLFVLALGSCSDHDDEGDFMTGKLKVLEYCPAPGQFINENVDLTTMEEARLWAEKRFEMKEYISLGAFGGYVTIQLPKVVKNRKGYDFAVVGNSFDGSSEPGIVWVSEDSNGNGVADDPWYELKGSDEPEREYEVTYYKPSAAGDVRWTDNKGQEGVISYLPEYHAQSYYPAWIEEASYRLKGSVLPARIVNEDGIWKNQSFGWGYADNMGKDIEKTSDGRYRYNQFELDNAIERNGAAVVLKQIHFIRIQSAILKNVPMIGEVSTEVCGIKVF